MTTSSHRASKGLDRLAATINIKSQCLVVIMLSITTLRFNNACARYLYM